MNRETREAHAARLSEARTEIITWLTLGGSLLGGLSCWGAFLYYVYRCDPARLVTLLLFPGFPITIVCGAAVYACVHAFFLAGVAGTRWIYYAATGSRMTKAE